jgi:hypothetical protein
MTGWKCDPMQKTGSIFKTIEPTERSSAWRRFLVAFILLALVVQGYVAQTHIHGLFPDNVASQASHTPGHSKYPPNDDPARCPICQQIVHGSQFVAPAWLTPFLLALAISTIEITDVALPRFNAVSHSWRGRGPPLH